MDIIQKWEKTGLLAGLGSDDQFKFAKEYEEMSQYIILNHNTGNKYVEWTNSIVLPIIYRILIEGGTFSIDKLYNDLLNFAEMNSTENLYETEPDEILCKIFADNWLKTVNNIDSDYDKFMKDYKLRHALCPKCKHEHCSSTLKAYPMYADRRHEYKNLNKCICLKCGDVHTKHERISKL